MKYPNGDTYEGQYAKLEVDDPAAVAIFPLVRIFFGVSKVIAHLLYSISVIFQGTRFFLVFHCMFHLFLGLARNL